MSAKLKEFGFLNGYDKIDHFLSEIYDSEFKNRLVSISGFGELISFTQKNRLIIATLNSAYNSAATDVVSFNVILQTEVTQNVEETVTALLVVPVASQKQSSQGLPDWTCICVGLSNGTVLFYDEFGQLIHSQAFNITPVQKFVLRSNLSLHSDLCGEDFMVLYNKSCFQIDGNHLFDSLNIFKKQMARLHAGFSEKQLIAELNFKKWLFDSPDVAVDIVFGSKSNECILDNLMSNAANKGPYVTISEQTYKYIDCVIVGKNPFVGFYKMCLDSNSLEMGDLAQVVYSKVKTALSNQFSSWIGGFSSQSTVTSKTLQKSQEIVNTDLPCRFQYRSCIDETERRATSAIGCPQTNVNLKLAIITDEFGRIFLLDIAEGTVLRIWKGYRDAQVSVTSSSDGSSFERKVNFLVIYAPRRGIMEIWSLPFGDRVASFDVRDRGGKLIHVPHSLLGLSKCQKINHKAKHSHSTFFLDSYGKISFIEVPFHLSLITSNNQRSQDQLVLRHFKKYLKTISDSLDSEKFYENLKQEFLTTARLLKLSGNVDFLLGHVLSLPSLSVNGAISICDELILLSMTDSLALSSNETDRLHLMHSFFRKKAIIVCYKDVINCTSNESDDKQEHELEVILMLAIEDSERLRKLHDIYVKYHEPMKATKAEVNSFILFASNFVVTNLTNTDCFEFELSKNATEKDILKLGILIFRRSVLGQQSVDKITDILIKQGKISRISCIRIYGTYLINENTSVVFKNMSNVKFIFDKLFTHESVSNEQGTEQTDNYKHFFQLLYNLCEKSSNFLGALLLSMVARVLILNLSNIQSDADDEEISEFWSQLLRSWNETCQRLEDMAVFDSFIRCCPVSVNVNGKKKSKISFERDLTLSRVLEHGRGMFSETFGKWASQWEFKFSDLQELYKSLATMPAELKKNDEASNLNTETKELFAILYKQLPHSLEYDSVLINVAWEYTRLWHKSIQRVEYLQYAVDLMDGIGPVGSMVVQGIGSMMWDVHISVGLSTLFPSEHTTDAHKYCSYLGLKVIETVIDMFNLILKSLINGDVIPAFSEESVWTGDKSRSSLVEMAISKDPISLSMLELHIEFLHSLQICNMLDIDYMTVYSLYNKQMRKYLLASFTKSIPSEIIYQNATESRTNRIQFLKSSILSCVRKFSQDDDDDTFLYEKIDRILRILTEKWAIDLENVNQLWVEYFYKCGVDFQAALYLDRVQNIQCLASVLLKIVGARIRKEYLSPKSRNYREYSKYLSNKLVKWFQSLDEEYVKETSITSLDQTSVLLDQVIEWLPENSIDFEISTCLQSLIVNVEKTKQYLE